jgi:hypothetical protein
VPWLIRLYLLVGVILAALVALRGHPPTPIPSYGLANEWVLRSEWFIAMIVLFGLLGILIVRGVFGGELPSKIGKDSIEWATATEKTEKAIDDLRRSVQDQAESLREQQEIIEASLGELKALAGRVDAIAGARPGGRRL